MTGAGGQRVRVGLTLPSFQPDPELVLRVARMAEEAGLDGVFLFDHLFRASGDAPNAAPRPALELLTMLAAVAATTSRVAVGSLVARATLRPPAVLRAGLDTVARIAPGRVIAGLGAGDGESTAENVAFGVEPPDLTPEDRAALRIARLDATAEALAGREYPVWVGGGAPAVLRIAATRADGWNHWGSEIGTFTALVGHLRSEVAAAGRDPAAFTATWGGLAILAATPAEAQAKRDRLGGDRPGVVWGDPARVAERITAYADAGAGWVVLGPVDSSNPDNAVLLGEAAAVLRGPR